mgnify:CR=1 FL=1
MLKELTCALIHSKADLALFHVTTFTHLEITNKILDVYDVKHSGLALTFSSDQTDILALLVLW